MEEGGRVGALGVALGLALVSLATPIVSATVREKWFGFPATAPLMLLPLACGAAWLWIWREVGLLRQGEKRAEAGSFFGAIAIFVLAFVGLAFSLFPFLVIDRMTIREAASHPSALKVMLVGCVIVLPMIACYTVFTYYVFRGKARQKLYD
jgi:cytochrome d ubiquinol oxidase subunit II